jgi:hypothetical protein
MCLNDSSNKMGEENKYKNKRNNDRCCLQEPECRNYAISITNKTTATTFFDFSLFLLSKFFPTCSQFLNFTHSRDEEEEEELNGDGDCTTGRSPTYEQQQTKVGQ